MHCIHCGSLNEKDSTYCIHCGGKISSSKSEHAHRNEDILFVPKKQNSHVLRNILILLTILGVLFIIIVALAYEETDYSTTETSDSNYDQSSSIYDLEIKDIDAEWDTGGIGIFYLKGTLVNNSAEYAQNVQIRVDLYKDEAQNNLFDTRYITLDGVSDYGAYTFREPIYDLNYEGQFWYTASVINADF